MKNGLSNGGIANDLVTLKVTSAIYNLSKSRTSEIVALANVFTDE